MEAVAEGDCVPPAAVALVARVAPREQHGVDVARAGRVPPRQRTVRVAHVGPKHPVVAVQRVGSDYVLCGHLESCGGAW